MQFVNSPTQHNDNVSYSGIRLTKRKIRVSKRGDNGDSDSWFVVTLRHFFLEFRELQCTDGRRQLNYHLAQANNTRKREQGGRGRVTVEVKRDKIDGGHDFPSSDIQKLGASHESKSHTLS